MDLLGQLLTPRAMTPGPIDDFWYQPLGTLTQAGVRIDAEGARKISAWYRGRDLLATSLAMLPFHVMMRLPDDGGAEPAANHPLYDILHRKPNPWQDAFQWKRQKMFHLIDHGNGYDRLVAGPNGFLDELHPIHPSLVTPEQVSSGRKVFHVRNPKTGMISTFSQDEIFHLCGASDDGIVGKGILDYARDSLGTALATESYAAKIFSNGTLNGGVIENPGVLDGEAGRRMALSFVSKVGEWHLPKILEQGSTFKPNDMTPEKAQMLLSRKFSIDDIARWLGVPPHMIGSLDRSTNNNIEQQGQEFVTYSLGQWASLFEFGVNDQLITVPTKYFAEFKRDALVRGDIAARWQAYHTAVTDGVFTRNEVRRLENKNKLPGLDEPLTPAHIVGKQEAPQAKPGQRTKPEPAEEDDGNEAEAMRGQAIARAAAVRILRTEVNAVQKAAVRHANNGDEFAAAVAEFYANHAGYVAKTLLMPLGKAHEYCAGQCGQVLGDNWLEALTLWQTSAYAAGLAAIALEDAA